MNQIRVHVDNGMKVEVANLAHNAANTRLLLALQQSAPNMRVECVAEDGVIWTIAVFRLVLDLSEIRMLNPGFR